MFWGVVHDLFKIQNSMGQLATDRIQIKILPDLRFLEHYLLPKLNTAVSLIALLSWLFVFYKAGIYPILKVTFMCTFQEQYNFCAKCESRDISKAIWVI